MKEKKEIHWEQGEEIINESSEEANDKDNDDFKCGITNDEESMENIREMEYEEEEEKYIEEGEKVEKYKGRYFIEEEKNSEVELKKEKERYISNDEEE